MAANETCDVLVLAAHPLELEGFSNPLGTALRGVVHGYRVACQAVGVGLVEAAAGAARALASQKPRVVVLVGSYGLFPDRDGALLELAALSRVRLIDSQVLAGCAALPEPMASDRVLDASLARGLATCVACVPGVTMATTLAITTDDRLAVQLSRAVDCRGENLEAFSIAQACHAVNVPMAALLGATNWVGSNGRAQWREHHAAVADKTARAIVQWISSEASGL